MSEEDINVVIPSLIERHGPRFMATIAEETDDRIINLQTSWPWSSRRVAQIQQTRRAGLRAAKLGATPRTRALLEYAAEYAAQCEVVNFISSTRGPLAQVPDMPKPAAYARQVAARLDAAPPPPPPPPPPKAARSKRSAGA
jgi:hypothetical protein